MTEEIVQTATEVEVTPAIKKVGSNTIISYKLPDFNTLTQAVGQVTDILRSIAPRFEFISLKKEIIIKVEPDTGDDSGIKMHFFIPRDLKKSIEPEKAPES